MLRLVKEIRIQQRDVEYPLRSNSATGASPIRLDCDGDGENDASLWLVGNTSWDAQGWPPEIVKLLIGDEDLDVERRGVLPGKIGRVFGPTCVRLDRNGDGLADSSFVFAGHFDPDCQMLWELGDDGSVEPLDILNRLTSEDEGPHGIAFARLDRDGDGIPEVTRVFYTGELTHRCTAYEIDDRTREAKQLCHFSEGDCCRSILAQRLDLDGDGRSDTTRLYVSLIDLLDMHFGAVKIFDLPDDADEAIYRARMPGPEKTQSICRATGTAAVRLDRDGDGRLDTTRYFAGSSGGGETDRSVQVFDIEEATCRVRHVARLTADRAIGTVGTLAVRIDSDGEGTADLTRLFVSLVNRLAVFDVSDDGAVERRDIIELHEHSYIYSVCPLFIDADGDGTIDRAHLLLTDSWGNRLAIYEVELEGNGTILAASPSEALASGTELRFASDETCWGAGLYTFTNYERLRVYQIQVARDAAFRKILHEDELDPAEAAEGQSRWKQVSYDVGKGKALTAYALEATGAYSLDGLPVGERYWWRIRGRDPVARTGWSSWASGG